ncbi:uncharacterized protein B0T23DRAFT_159787 [Neurospora hispaniola]|uniref:Uncharacterized protein n=1 Tax=Neurospora hispaniola TaxID=588809 RepID=A0AAJ0I5I8_9PEZI|nr:hypothetical protein B0T23DRAFT_159787 [Neurospora hispaniola]
MTQPPIDGNTTTTTTNTNENDIFTDAEAEAAAMAAAMGFSSFGHQATADEEEEGPADPHGGQRPSKKRRYNSRIDDAYVGPTPQGTGANDVPVQRQRVLNNNAPRDGDMNEINLDDDTAAAAETSTTSLPVNSSLSLPPKSQVQVSNQQHNQRGNHGVHSGRGGGRGGRGGRGGHGGGGGGGGGSGGGTHGRDPTKPWYIDYYDPSSNENPWERLEQQRGMEAVGKWLPSRSGGGSGSGSRGGFGSPGSGPGSGQQEGQSAMQAV